MGGKWMDFWGSYWQGGCLILKNRWSMYYTNSNVAAADGFSIESANMISNVVAHVCLVV